jgi:hypothetical protein
MARTFKDRSRWRDATRLRSALIEASKRFYRRQARDAERILTLVAEEGIPLHDAMAVVRARPRR